MPKARLNSEKFRAFMTLRDLNISGAARLLGVDNGNLSRTLHGTRGVGMSLVRGLMAIGLDPKDFILPEPLPKGKPRKEESA